jgi:hypothetical protein
MIYKPRRPLNPLRHRRRNSGYYTTSWPRMLAAEVARLAVCCASTTAIVFALHWMVTR